jgi:predicted O-methyltransferase YrrM
MTDTMLVADPETYFSALVPKRGAILEALEEEAAAEEIPIVGPVVGELLFILARAAGAKRILELGAATGYSAIYLGEAVKPGGGRVLTLENDPDMVKRARENISSAALSEVVSVREGDALKVIPTLTGAFDMVFMDIEKEDYLAALLALQGLVTPAGLLIADNTGFKDADPFNRHMAESGAWRSVQLFSFLPKHSGRYDGLCVAVRL